MNFRIFDFRFLICDFKQSVINFATFATEIKTDRRVFLNRKSKI